MGKKEKKPADEIERREKGVEKKKKTKRGREGKERKEENGRWRERGSPDGERGKGRREDWRDGEREREGGKSVVERERKVINEKRTFHY